MCIRDRAHIMTQKYVMYSPLYRLEQEFQRQGLKLSRQTMANWILQASDTWLRPVYDALHRKLCKETVLHGDETTLQVLKEPGRTSASKSYMWLYRTSGCAEYPIVLYLSLIHISKSSMTREPIWRRGKQNGTSTAP